MMAQQGITIGYQKMKKLTMALLLVPTIVFAQDKYYDRNQLPQLNQEILEQSQFEFTATEVPVSSLIPVQTQRVRDLKKQEKRLIKVEQNTYRPLVIDQQYYIIDGHHRYDALSELGFENARVLLVNAPIEEVVEEFQQYRDNTPTYTPVEQDIVEEVLVVGTRATLMRAVDKQMMADGIISVVDSDALGNFPDTTAADAIRRLSGISVENDQGEGRYVTIRGLSSDLNSVAVNGASMVAPENGRSVIMDGIPTELMDSITVSKTLTPDMDSDSIGGRIAFNTKKPTDLNEMLLKVKVSSKFAEYTDYEQAPNFSVTYGDNITDNTAHIMGLTYSSKNIESYNNETGFGWEDGYMNDDFELRYYDLTRERYGFSYDINTLLDSGAVVFANVMYNQYEEDELRFKNEYGKIKMAEPFENSMLSSRVRHDAETRQRFETRSIGAMNLGAEFDMADWEVDTQLSYSWAEEDDSDNADITFRNYDKDNGAVFDWSNPVHPFVTPVDETLRNPENLEFDAFEMWSNVSKDSETTFQINADNRLWKVGFKHRSRTKNVDDYIIAYEWDDMTMADFEFKTAPGWFFPNQVFGNHMTAQETYNLRNLTDQMSVDFSDDISRDFITDETINSVYAQRTVELEKTTIIAGVRYEHTDFESTAYDQDGNRTYAENDYGFVAPSVTVKHWLTDNWQVRGALWRGLSRPGFKETAPITDYDVDTSGDTSGSIGNPNLKPYEADNFDLSLEYYGEGMTYFAVGYFHKSIANAIYPTYQRNGVFNGISFNDGVETWINADDSRINGIELNAQYGWENGLYVATNFTLTDSESTFNFEDDASFTTPFRKLADKAANVNFGYDKGAWDIRVAGNYRSDYLDWLADEDGDIGEVSVNNSRFVDDFIQWDLTVKYDVNDNFTVKAEAVNLNNRPEYYYWGDESQLSQYDMYGKNYSIGFNYTF
tara:strand:- start:158 stop:2989 length:2832 start_codon:yes stop_codon:yes gene_type:complete